MLSGKTRSEIDQANTFMIEYMPPLWKGLYLGMMSEGFTEDQAMRLLVAYIIGQNITGVKP
jgi:hypothetical protein